MDDPAGMFQALQSLGVITRSTPGGLRVSVGSDAELRRFFEAFDELRLV
jgi:histidinol-phosphate/aromatic aminotransferase/cobyric acid decarboxylase-like protein